MLDSAGEVLSQIDSSLSTPMIESSSGTLSPAVSAIEKAVSAILSDAAKSPIGRWRDKSVCVKLDELESSVKLVQGNPHFLMFSEKVFSRCSDHGTGFGGARNTKLLKMPEARR